jgi:hypothetical protein
MSSSSGGIIPLGDDGAEGRFCLLEAALALETPLSTVGPTAGAVRDDWTALVEAEEQQDPRQALACWKLRNLPPGASIKFVLVFIFYDFNFFNFNFSIIFVLLYK